MFKGPGRVLGAYFATTQFCEDGYENGYDSHERAKTLGIPRPNESCDRFVSHGPMLKDENRLSPSKPLDRFDRSTRYSIPRTMHEWSA